MSASAALLCLAMTVYHEARGESFWGQVAVASVVMNRVESGKYPRDVCKVVTQKRQFSFAWAAPLDTVRWDTAVQIAEQVMGGEVVDPTFGALHYTKVNVKVVWQKKMTGRRIGNHVFWK